MDFLLYALASTVVRALQALPLRWVARIGRAGGALAYWIDGRHRRVAIDNLTRCFGKEKSAGEIRAIARENFKRLGECYSCGLKTASMTWEDLEPHLEVGGLEKMGEEDASEAGSELPPSGVRVFRAPQKSCVMAIGHFGNFELYARARPLFPEHEFATTYRALKQPGLNRLLVDLRARSGCLLFERRRDSEALRGAMNNRRLVLGLLSDQHAGTGGAWIPFFGHECSTTMSPAIFSLRYEAPLYPAICYRIDLARWRIEIGEEIPTTKNGTRRSSEEIMLDVNRAFEAAIRRDPANWFWVHRRWKKRESSGRESRSRVSTANSGVAPHPAVGKGT